MIFHQLKMPGSGVEYVKENKLINEIFVLRAIACLVVVLLHSVSSYLGHLNSGSEDVERSLRVFQLFLMFGTPTFIFISEVLISNSYQEKIPSGFFSKRVKFILVPYIVMGIFYAWFSLWELGQLNSGEFLINSLENVFLGGYHGYFVLIVFQFYILHFIFQRYVADKYSPLMVLGTSLVVNLGYLGLFNVIRLPQSSNEYLLTFWSDDFKLLFFGWIFYFAVAFYCGRNFDKVKGMVNRNVGKIGVALILSIALLMFDYFILGFESIHSKRFDNVFYTISMIGILLFLASKIKKVPYLIMLVSRYSFGIYLLHPFFISIFENYVVFTNNVFLYIAMTFLLAVVCSILLTFLFNKFNIGAYAVGKVRSKGRFSSQSKAQKRKVTA